MPKIQFMPPLVVLFVCLTVILPGCRTVPVQNFSSPVPAIEKNTDKEITAAIIRAGAITGWDIIPVKPGLMTGTFVFKNKHRAVVDITYNEKEYAIAYRGSRNLKYADGKIHKQYNIWATELDSNIRQELINLTR